MFKKIIPAIAFMFVLALSFAFRPAPAKAAKGKTLSTIYYVYDGPLVGWHTETTIGNLPGCESTGAVCYIETDSEVDATIAKQAALNHGNFSQDFSITDVDDEEDGDQSIEVVVRAPF